jgi:hypothetical protein
MTQAQRNKHRDKLIKQLDRDLFARGRLKLRELREHLKHAKRWRAQRLPEIRIICKRNRDIARERAKVARAEIAAAAKLAKHTATEQIRREARADCQAKKALAHVRGLDSIGRAQVAIKAEAEMLDAVRRAGRAVKLGKSSRRTAPRMTAAERRAESDDEVRNNIDPELLPVWEKLKSKIKATERMTRTEAFAHWAHDHAQEVRNMVDAAAEASIAELLREEKRIARELRDSKPKRLARARRMLAAETYQDAPF